MKYYQHRLTAQIVKECIPPEDFYLREQNLEDLSFSNGKQWAIAGLCPFHADRQPGSFVIHPIAGAFHCFSCGHRGGDIIAYAQMKYNISFKEALEKLNFDWSVL